LARLVQKASALAEEPSKGSGAEPSTLDGVVAAADMVGIALETGGVGCCVRGKEEADCFPFDVEGKGTEDGVSGVLKDPGNVVVGASGVRRECVRSTVKMLDSRSWDTSVSSSEISLGKTSGR
jgi:hypothetical protein